MQKIIVNKIRCKRYIFLYFCIIDMKQEELATLVGVRRETIGNLENGKYNPSLKLAMDIAKVFQKSVEEIFEFVEEMKE